MHPMEMVHYIKKTVKAMDHNLHEAEEHIRRAYDMRDKCSMSADWYKEMAHRHMEFNAMGRAIYDRKMRELSEMPEAAEYMPGIRAAYNDWVGDINEKAAEVAMMIQMYK